jgi:hypothetical protein
LYFHLLAAGQKTISTTNGEVGKKITFARGRRRVQSRMVR